ncbi:MAG TPA: M13 family metallopeptidase [Candidatus Alistipes avicola]|uniref:M13 family metallopeptidase n=2 Tax=Alistipes TaxID=239759 RepID=A0A9D2IBI8_9BACT|nr:M13 family metallopeptidase [Candidatus Alistipes avicola]
MMGCQNKTTTPAIDLTNMDTSVAPNESFYQYATGGWQAKHPLKPEHSMYGAFNVLADNNELRINELFTQMGQANPEKGTVNQKIVDLYKMGLDSARLNKEGAAPIKAGLESILSLENKEQLTPMLSIMQMTTGSPFFSFGPEADLMNSKENVLYIGQAGIGMGNRDYYLDAENESIREAYKAYLGQLFTLAGLEEAQVGKAVDAVMRIETTLAENMRSNVELRDIAAMYNPMATADLVKNYDAIDWKGLFDYAKIAPERVIVCQPEYMEALDKLIEETPIEDIRYYLASQYLNAAAPYLDDNFYAASFDFYGRTMSGKEEPRPRWKRAMAVPNSVLGEAVGKMYVEKYFSADDKARMITLVDNLRTALGQHIDQLDWMSDSTKMRAHEKLDAFRVKIGYPDKWKDYSTLEIDPTLSYWENIQRANEWATRDAMAKAGKPVDPEEWLMTPQTVNAYYNPTTNEICFPAAILQPPFYNPEADDAVNYGAIGVVIGHEMTHGFDDQGRQFDKDGNMNNWWTDADAEAFKKKTDILVKQFDAIEVLPARDGQPALYANGSLCLGENIADQGGLRIAFTALQNSFNGEKPAPIDGFTPEQRFYLAYATVWGENIRDEEIARLTKLDVHSLGKWRVDATLRNIQDFYDAFGITDGKMFLPVEERVIIW